MTIELDAPDGVGEITTASDLAEEIAQVLTLRDGDIVVVTSKVVSKVEGRVRPYRTESDREAAIDGETTREVARRGPVRIVENRLGLVMAAAGVDASNLESGTLALLPEDPDASARRLRERLASQLAVNVGIVIADTAGRPWRLGQTDIAIGLAGLDAYEDFDGAIDAYGNELAVTAPAVADEIAGAAELASGKLGARPFVRIRGLGHRVLPAGVHGSGARALQRSAAEDLFAFGSRDAVIHALSTSTAWCPAAGTHDLVRALEQCGLTVTVVDAARLHVEAADDHGRWRAEIVAKVHGWRSGEGSGELVPS
ncbi:MAG: coenzyme F420-0:L-glutamate ligase [Marmoricola sp.]